MKFHNPFPGKRAPVELCRLFVVKPSTLIKLLGTSLSGIFAELGESALYRELKSSSPSASKIERLLAQMPPENSMRAQLSQALDGDQKHIDSLMMKGDWELFLNGMQADINSLPNALLINIENACREPQLMADRGEYHECARLLREHALMRMFFWDEVLHHLAKCNDKNDLLFIQSSIAMEVCLSHLAAVDAERSQTGLPIAMNVIPDKGKNPTQRLFHWLKQQTGAQSITRLLNDKRASKLNVDTSTMKRWSTGRYLPSASQIEQLIDAFFGEAVAEIARFNYFAARYLNFIGHFSSRCECAVRAMPIIDRSPFPWPNYPFGYESFEDWSKNRYQFWFDWHMAIKKERT